jgi:hypothetical protein
MSRGRDTGEFGAAPLDIIEREYRLFQRPVQWFFDATRVINPTRAVTEEWTAWLRRKREVLGHLHILTSAKETRLLLDVARHFSDSSDRMTLYTGLAEWSSAVLRSVPQLSSLPDLAAQLDQPPVAISREWSAERGTTLTAPGASWSFRGIASGVLFSRFSGNDSGDLTDTALDEMEQVLAASGGKVSWFLDLRDGQNVVASVSRTWTEWLGSRQDRFARITVLAPSPLFPLVLTIAGYSSGTERLVRIHRDLEPFRIELAAISSGETARSAGV